MLMHNPPHPSEVLKELCIEPLGITVTDTAKGLGISRKTLASILNGKNTNQAESLFSRFRRMQYRQFHRMSNLYMDRYANEVAYREDTRRTSNGFIFNDIISRCANAQVSRDFCGY